MKIPTTVVHLNVAKCIGIAGLVALTWKALDVYSKMDPAEQAKLSEDVASVGKRMVWYGSLDRLISSIF